MQSEPYDWVHDPRQVLNECENWPQERWSSRDMAYWVARCVQAESMVEETVAVISPSAAQAVAEASKRSNPSSTLQFLNHLGELGYEVVKIGE